MVISLEYIVGSILGAIIAVTAHELSKAFISSSLGDPLPKRDGRLSFNPLKHIEPIGFLLMVALGFGWGKPVETASIYYKDRRNGTLITYIAPSIINLLVGVVIVLIMSLIRMPSNISNMFQFAAMVNLRLAFFNIIPVYPLDGAKVVSALRNPNHVITMVNNQTFYQIALMIFVGWGIVGRVIDPICIAIINSIGVIYW